MGHERVGCLPKTKRWRALMGQVGSMYSSGIPMATVAAQTLQNVRTRYEILFQDEAVRSTFAFLVTFSRACRFRDARGQLQAAGIDMSGKPSMLAVVKALRTRVSGRATATEYGQLALAAAADAVAQWDEQHSTGQLRIPEEQPDAFESWRGLGNGTGFCELARLYFGRLTERYLHYFLDRAASASIADIQQRARFQRDIRVHVDEISRHAFETAKITQSFAAGWYSKHAREKSPSDREIGAFLTTAFGKLRDELRREQESQ